MIRGVGVDIVDCDRIADALAHTGESFARRVLTETEFPLWEARQQSPHFLAKHWAVKEAFVKACGTGMRAPLTWHGLWLVHDALGAPQIEVAPQVQNWLTERKMLRWHVSIADEKQHAIAFVVIEG